MTNPDKLDVLLDGLTFPEGPRWHDGKLWLSDFYSHRVIKVGVDGRAETVVDGAGRAYVGNFGFDRHAGEAPRATCLVRVDLDGRTSVAADELMFPNGTVIA